MSIPTEKLITEYSHILIILCMLTYNCGVKELGRCNFLKLAGYGVAASGIILFGKQTYNSIEDFGDYITNLDYLDGVKSPPNPLPDSLKGITLNSPFLWQRDDEYVRWVASQAVNIGAKTIRIFINDEFEPELGRINYDNGVLEDIKRIATKLSGVKLVVSLFDCYSLLHQDKPNIDYLPSPLSSPYYLENPGKTREEKQLYFFNNPKMKSCFFERLDHCARYLDSVEEITAWEIANEPELGDKTVLTDWYKESIDTVRKIDDTRPIITGLAKPFLIDEGSLMGNNIVNSFHAYPLNIDVLKILTDHSSKSHLPLAGLETGIGKKLKPVIKLPQLIFLILNSVISENTLYAGNVGLWKIDDYEDGYDISDSKYSIYFQNLAEKLSSI